MRILFNQMATLQTKTGVGHYAQQLRQQLSHRPDCQLTVFPSDRWLRWTKRIRRCVGFADQLPALLDRRRPVHNGDSRTAGTTSQRGRNTWARLRYRQWIDQLSRKNLFSDRFDLYHEPNFIPLPTSLPIVATVHDLSVLLHPEWHPVERVQWYEDHFARNLEQVSHIITVSEFTRQQVIQVLGISSDRVTSVANGPRPEFRPLPRSAIASVLRRYGLSSQYLLYVGTIEPRKNVLLLMQAYISLPAGLRRDWPLVLAGCWGWNVDGVREFYEGVAVHEGVRHLGYLPDDDLPALLNGARALLYPSLYEGFGLPPLEMMACGGAVLASRIPPHIEVTGGAAHLIAPEDIAGWRDAIARVIHEQDWHYQLCGEGAARAECFSWARSAAETAQVYRSVIDRNSRSSRRTDCDARTSGGAVQTAAPSSCARTDAA